MHHSPFPLRISPPVSERAAGYMPAGHRSGAHADSVWPYLEESRRLGTWSTEEATKTEPPAQPSSWIQRFIERLHGDPEAR